MLKIGFHFVVFLLVPLGFADHAQALQVYLEDPSFGFKAYYDSASSGMPEGAGSKMDGCYHCTICHAGLVENSTNINAYAQQWRDTWASIEMAATGKARQPDENPNTYSVQALKKMESTDPDGDGAMSGAEIQGGSNPGDPSSTPSEPHCQEVASLGSENGYTVNSPYNNPNSLNAKCSVSPVASAGMIRDAAKSSEIAEIIALMLMPLLLLVLLRCLPVKKSFT